MTDSIIFAQEELPPSPHTIFEGFPYLSATTLSDYLDSPITLDDPAVMENKSSIFVYDYMPTTVTSNY